MSSTSQAAPEKQAIISPAIDFLCCGGISILVVLGFFVLMLVDPDNPLLGRPVSMTDILVLALLFNFPHFMASYRILYRRREQITEHSWASIYAPLVMLALIAYAVLTPSNDPNNPEFANGAIVELFGLTAGLLLAWHYTGQAWGMTASFLFIGGIRLEDVERRLIRSGYYALMVLHLIWTCLVAMDTQDEFVLFSSLFRPYLPLFEMLFFGWWIVVAFTIPLGIWGFVRASRRTGKPIPYRAFAPWLAIYSWYALISVQPGLIALLQIFHSLQYLIFPIRVEMNQHAMAHSSTSDTRAEGSHGLPGEAASERSEALHGALYYLALVAAGFVVFAAPHLLRFYSTEAFLAVNALVLGFVNIHHYVIDGVIWKIRNPAVRRDLFAHLHH